MYRIRCFCGPFGQTDREAFNIVMRALCRRVTFGPSLKVAGPRGVALVPPPLFICSRGTTTAAVSAVASVYARVIYHYVAPGTSFSATRLNDYNNYYIICLFSEPLNMLIATGGRRLIIAPT